MFCTLESGELIFLIYSHSYICIHFEVQRLVILYELKTNVQEYFHNV